MAKTMFAFSADPIHYGHIDIIKRAAKVFDEVIAGIGKSPDKNYMFSLEERMEMTKKALADIPNAKVTPYEGMTVDYAYENNIPVIVKSVRNTKDSDYERVLHDIGKSQKLGIDTFVLFARPELAHISSSAAKAIQKEHGLIHEYVPLHIKQKLEAKMLGQHIVGITGEIGCGKSYASKKFEELGKKKGIPVLNIELDHIGHEILSTRKEPRYELVRQQIAQTFGEHVMLSDGTINRKALGDIVFNDYSKLQELNEIMYTPMLVRLRRELTGKKGLILINAALIAESKWSFLCNNNVILINVDKETQERRLKKRDDLIQEQIQRRLESQYNFAKKKGELEKAIEKDRHGKIWDLQSSDNPDESEKERVFDSIIEELKIKKTNEP